MAVNRAALADHIASDLAHGGDRFERACNALQQHSGSLRALRDRCLATASIARNSVMLTGANAVNCDVGSPSGSDESRISQEASSCEGRSPVDPNVNEGESPGIEAFKTCDLGSAGHCADARFQFPRQLEATASRLRGATEKCRLHVTELVAHVRANKLTSPDSPIGVLDDVHGQYQCPQGQETERSSKWYGEITQMGNLDGLVKAAEQAMVEVPEAKFNNSQQSSSMSSKDAIMIGKRPVPSPLRKASKWTLPNLALLVEPLG